MKLKTGLLLVVGAVLTCTGCASHPTTGGSSNTTVQNQVEVSRAKSYQTMAELKRDSTAIVRVTATATTKKGPADEAGRSPLTVTLTTVRLDEVLFGNVPARRALQIRQLGGAGTVSDDLPPRLSAGQQYVLYIKPFEFVHGHPLLGEYIVTGDVGQFQVESNGELRRALPQLAGLPKTLSFTQLRQAAMH